MCHWLSVLAEESVARQPVWLAKKVRGLNFNIVQAAIVILFLRYWVALALKGA